MITKVSKSLGLLLLMVCLNRCSMGPESNEPILISWQAKWLQRNVVRVSSAGPGNEDFSDLESLKADIGDARLVMLGEQTHGDGTTFLAKVRLIKFLHREMGFDVVAFESGLYDCHKVWADIEAGDDAVTAARRGIYTLWSNCLEVRPLFEYISQMATEGQILEIAGFDCNVSGSNARDYLVADLEVFLRNRNAQVLGDPDWLPFKEDLQYFLNDSAYTPSPVRRTTFFRVLDSARQEMDTFAARQRPLMQSPAFWKQLLSSIRQQAHRYWIIQDDNLRGNARDAQMADNLKWLMQNPYRNRKVVAWAATFHIIRNLNEIDPLEPDLSYSIWIPMGHHLWQEMGDSIYSIGFTAYQGTYLSTSQNKIVEIEPSSTGSIEYLMNEAGIELGMLDLRHLPDDGAWLREPLLSRPMGNQEMKSNWSRNLDALFFIKETRHSTFR